MLGQNDVVNTEWRKLHAKDSVETTTKKAELQELQKKRDGKRYAYRQQGLGLCCGPRGKKRSADSDDDSDDDEDSVEMSTAEEDVAAEVAEAVATHPNETKSKEVRAACARPALHCACYSSHYRAGVRPRQLRVCGGPLPIGCRRRLPQEGHATGQGGAPPLTRPYPVPTPPPLELHAL